jgi:hypothetical protein
MSQRVELPGPTLQIEAGGGGAVVGGEHETDILACVGYDVAGVRI